MHGFDIWYVTQITSSVEFFGCATQPLTDSGAVPRRPSVDGLRSIRRHEDFRAYTVKWWKIAIKVGNAENVCRYSHFNAEEHCKASIILSTNK